MMQPVLSLLALGALASPAAAAARDGFQFPDTVPMSKRQTSDPSYQCHANCGYTIQDSREDGYCEDDDWLALLEDCLDCALEYDIWGDYGDYVSAAAQACGLESTPEPVDDSGDSEFTTTTVCSTAVSSMAAPVTSSLASAAVSPESVTGPQHTLTTTPTGTGYYTPNATAAPTSIPESVGAQTRVWQVLIAFAAVALTANLV